MAICSCARPFAVNSSSRCATDKIHARVDYSVRRFRARENRRGFGALFEFLRRRRRRINKGKRVGRAVFTFCFLFMEVLSGHWRGSGTSFDIRARNPIYIREHARATVRVSSNEREHIVHSYCTAPTNKPMNIVAYLCIDL